MNLNLNFKHMWKFEMPVFLVIKTSTDLYANLKKSSKSNENNLMT